MLIRAKKFAGIYAIYNGPKYREEDWTGLLMVNFVEESAVLFDDFYFFICF
jgi:hypothetical protein